MIKGISSEKPAEVFVRWMERIWSAYEVTGERIRLSVKRLTDACSAFGVVGKGRNRRGMKKEKQKIGKARGLTRLARKR